MERGIEHIGGKVGEYDCLKKLVDGLVQLHYLQGRAVARRRFQKW